MRIENVLSRIVADYPAEEIDRQRRDVARVAFNISLITTDVPIGGRIADIGGGLGLFSPGCAELGWSVVLADDFQDLSNTRIAEDVLQRVHRKRGVEVISRDVIADGVDFPPVSFDAITTFDSMEHWHHSPKKLFRQLMRALKPGGLFVIGVPNCVNLRKRIMVPVGVGKWSRMEEWYEPELFREHVREPDVDDLRYIARDLALIDMKILGRNWLGRQSRYAWIRSFTPLVDRLLWPFPSLCSDIYLVGRK